MKYTVYDEQFDIVSRFHFCSRNFQLVAQLVAAIRMILFFFFLSLFSYRFLSHEIKNIEIS